MYQLNHTYSIRATELRRAIDPHKEWIEKQLGISLADAVIIATDISFCDAAIPSLIGFADPSTPVVTAIRRLRERIQSVQVPPSHVPLIALEKERALDLLLRRFKVDRRELSTFSMEWADGPVGIRLRDLSVPIVALSASYHEGPNSSHEAQQELVVIAREGISGFIELLKTLTATDSKSRLHVGNDRPRPVARCDWDQLVLDPSVVALLRNDFDSFFEREAWFRKMRLPFRRGYLLHGPPGNGKSTAIRAMLTSRGLSAYTIRFFGKDVDDEQLEKLFEKAAENAPSIVLLEDIDRCFPRAGGSATKVSLQQLLNSLDGVASGDGIVTLATANDPSALDSAILKRPGRFDRVVLFSDPTAELRHRYFVQMHPPFADVDIDEAIEESSGFSFALLREAFIMAAQTDFVNEREITVKDLLASIWSLRGSLLFGTMKTSAGFALPSGNKRGTRE
jgi:hypothetical protein